MYCKINKYNAELAAIPESKGTVRGPVKNAIQKHLLLFMVTGR